MTETKTIAETNRFIVLDRYDKDGKLMESYQSEDSLERELIDDLGNLGYIFERELNTPAKLLANARTQLQTLNNVQFTESEWTRFVETYLDRPSDHILEKTRKIHDDYIHDFVFDDGHIQNIYDGCLDHGIRVVDVRHEQSAAHAADAWARVTGQPGVAAVNQGLRFACTIPCTGSTPVV